MKFLGLLLAVECLAFMQPAYAQSAQQTPENAHRFLNDLASMGLVKIAPPENVETKIHYIEVMVLPCRVSKSCLQPAAVKSEMSGASYSLNITSSSACLTKLSGKPTIVELEEAPAEKRGYPPTIIKRPFKPFVDKIFDQGINWSQVTDISVREDTPNVAIHTHALEGRAFSLIFSTPEVATRAAFALETIRQSCDPLAGSVF